MTLFEVAARMKKAEPRSISVVVPVRSSGYGRSEGGRTGDQPGRTGLIWTSPAGDAQGSGSGGRADHT
jgi:hypothetical protein